MPLRRLKPRKNRFLVLAATAGFSLFGCPSEERINPPNILLIVIETLRGYFDDLFSQGTD